MLVVNVIEDITEVKRAELGQRMLARAGELLASSLDYERTLQQVAELAVPELADWCAVACPTRSATARRSPSRTRTPSKVAFARGCGERYPRAVDAPTAPRRCCATASRSWSTTSRTRCSRPSRRTTEHLELLREFGTAGRDRRADAGGRGATIGALTLISADPAGASREADVDLAEELARRAGAAVENARLYTERSTIARTLQTGLLPGACRHARLVGATLYRPAGDENWVGRRLLRRVAAGGAGWRSSATSPAAAPRRPR